jgi:hypothetical protein
MNSKQLFDIFEIFRSNSNGFNLIILFKKWVIKPTIDQRVFRSVKLYFL